MLTVCSYSELKYNAWITLSQGNKTGDTDRKGKAQIIPKLSPFVYDTILYLKDPEDSTRKLLDLINTSANNKVKVNMKILFTIT